MTGFSDDVNEQELVQAFITFGVYELSKHPLVLGADKDRNVQPQATLSKSLCQQTPRIVSIISSSPEARHMLITQIPCLLTAESKHRGFAFITFSSPMDAQDAIDNYDFNELPGRQGQGRYLKVNLARPDNKAAGAAGMRGDRAGTCKDDVIHSAYLIFTLTTRSLDYSVWASEEWLVEHAKPLDESRGPEMQAALPPGMRRKEETNKEEDVGME